MPLHPRSSDLTIDQLRSLWLTNRDPGVRQALEELVFRREQVRRKEAVIRRVETLYGSSIRHGMRKSAARSSHLNG